MAKNTKSVQFAEDTRLATLTGHVIRFEACVPRTVSDKVYRECMAKGGIDGSYKITKENDGEDNDETQNATNHDGGGNPILLIAEAAKEIIEEGDTNSFSESGKIKCQVLSERCGITVTAEQRDEAQKMVEDGEVD